jgi:hypothetical protein
VRFIFHPSTSLLLHCTMASADDDIPFDDDNFVYYSYPSSPDLVGLAALAIWAYLIPHLYIEYSECKLALERSPKWGVTNVGSSSNDCTTAKQRLARTLFIHAFLGALLFTGSSALISRLTIGMDRRASDIAVGISRLFAGVIFFILSVNLAQWLGLYYSVSPREKMERITNAKCLREVNFSFAWSIWRQLLTMYFFNLYFSCRTSQFTYLYGFLGKDNQGGTEARWAAVHFLTSHSTKLCSPFDLTYPSTLPNQQWCLLQPESAWGCS